MTSVWMWLSYTEPGVFNICNERFLLQLYGAKANLHNILESLPKKDELISIT